MNLFISSFVVTLIAPLFLYLGIRGLGLEKTRYSYLYAIAPLPLSALVNLFIKKPIFVGLFSFFHVSENPYLWPLWFLVIAHFVPPVTEEAIKVLPIIILPTKWRLIKNKGSAFVLGSLLGFGFGIGEAWYLAWMLTKKMPELASGSIFKISGFFGERFVVTLIHASLTALVVYGIFLKRPVKYYLIAILFHAILNIGAALFQTGRISIYLTTIPFTISLFLFLNFVFKLERNIRAEIQVDRKHQVLYKRKEPNKTQNERN